MVLSVGCSSGVNLSTEQKERAIRHMESGKYFFDNGFIDTWDVDDTTHENFLTKEDYQEWIDKDESKAEFNSDMFNLMIASKNLVEQRVNDGVESGDKETSFESQEFVKTYNEINKKYKLGLDKLK